MATRSQNTNKTSKGSGYHSSPAPTNDAHTRDEPVRKDECESSDSSDSCKSNNGSTSALSGRTFRKKKTGYYKQPKLSKIDVGVF